MEEKLIWSLVLGTAREGASSNLVVDWIKEFLNDRSSIEFQVIKGQDMILGGTVPPGEENQVADNWRRTAKESDGFLLVVPEYNSGYPGELKILLDSAYHEYADKPVLLVGVSAGGFGAIQAVTSLREILWKLKMVPISTGIHISHINEVFDKQGGLLKNEYQEKLRSGVEELEQLSRLLKQKRRQK